MIPQGWQSIGEPDIPELSPDAKAVRDYIADNQIAQITHKTESVMCRALRMGLDRLQDFVKPVSQIGMRKLLMLTALTDDQREELSQTVDLESTTVRELREQIAALKEESELDRKERDNANEAAQRWKNTAQSAQADNQRLEDQVQSLTDQVRELERRPVEVAVPEPSHELQNMQDAMRRINLEHEQWSAKMQDDHIKHVQEINRQHRAETDALRAEYEEKLAAAQASPAETPEPDSKEIFKAYLANAIDAVKRMTAFLAAHPNEACRAQAERFFTAAMKEVQNEQTV